MDECIYELNGKEIRLRKTGIYSKNGKKKVGDWLYANNSLFIRLKNKIVMFQSGNDIRFDNGTDRLKIKDMRKMYWLTNNIPNILVLILTCKKNKDKVDMIRRTWLNSLKRFNITHLFLEADCKIDGDYKLVDDTLYVKCLNNYETLPTKMHMGYIAINALYPNIDGVFKIDDDCYMDVIRLLFEIRKNKSNDYWGKCFGPNIDPTYHFGKCKDKSLNTTPYFLRDIGCEYCGGGYGYYLSRLSIKIIANSHICTEKEFYEDIYIGKLLNRFLIAPKNINICGGMAKREPNRAIYISDKNHTEYSEQNYRKLWDTRICI